MRLLFSLFIAHLSFLSSFSQINLIPNGGFEELSECPSSVQMTEIPGIELAISWWNCTYFDMDNYGTANIFNLCVDSFFIQYLQNYYIGNQTPFQGNGFAGFYAYNEPINPNDEGSYSLWGEYLSCKLLDNIYPGKNYLLRFQISLSQVFANYNIKNLKVAFFSDSIKSSGINFIQDDINIVFPENANYDFFEISGLDSIPINGWSEMQIVINPNNVSSHIAIGTFKSNYTIYHEGGYIYSHEPTGLNILSEPTTYYLIDDVSLTEIADTTSVKEINSAKFKLFPNPLSDNLNIRNLNVKGEFDVSLLDATGRLIQNQQFSGIGAHTLDLNGLAKGIYYCRVMQGGEVIVVEKIVKLN